MATFDDTRHSLSSGHFFPFAAAAFYRATEFVTAVRNRRQVAKLLSWDAHMLRDIGLTPGDVQSAMAGRLRDDPSYRLDTMARERRSAFRAAACERRAGR
jgi:uncharacterized protein YjiS (DUF1127 family)